MENQTGKKINVLRCDNGGEYKSNVFNLFCQTHGIKCQFTTSYTPQQNGVSERKNRTLLGAVLAMLFDSKLSNRYWGEAIQTANYLQNRSPTKALSPNTTPFE